MRFILIAAFAVILISACKKNGTGGNATIVGHVMHHEVHIPNAMVYIKYNATESPGTDVTVYDDSIQASSGDGHYEFENLLMGNYYLYGVGFDSSISESVFGGVPLKIKYNERKEIIETNVPVVE